MQFLNNQTRLKFILLTSSDPVGQQTSKISIVRLLNAFNAILYDAKRVFYSDFQIKGTLKHCTKLTPLRLPSMIYNDQIWKLRLWNEQCLVEIC